MKVRKLLGLTAPKGQSLQPGDARVYSNMGGPAVEGEVVLKTSTWRVELGDYSYGRLEADTTPRNMGPNRPIPASCLARPELLADWIRRQGWPLP